MTRIETDQPKKRRKRAPSSQRPQRTKRPPTANYLKGHGKRGGRAGR